MWKHIIAPAPAGKLPEVTLDKDGVPHWKLWGQADVSLSGKPDSCKAFYAKIAGENVALMDYLSEEDPPADAIYVCEQRSPIDFVVTKAQPADLGTIHNFAGWPNPDGAAAVKPKISATAIIRDEVVKG